MTGRSSAESRSVSCHTGRRCSRATRPAARCAGWVPSPRPPRPMRCDPSAAPRGARMRWERPQHESAGGRRSSVVSSTCARSSDSSVDCSQVPHRPVVGRRRSKAIPVGWTDRSEALPGWFDTGRVRLVTTSRSPHARRYCAASRSTNTPHLGPRHLKQDIFQQVVRVALDGYEQARRNESPELTWPLQIREVVQARLPVLPVE